MSVDLTVIVIARNEEATIGPCLEACIRSVRGAQQEDLIQSAEVILADSASTDRTVEIARAFPVTIVQLRPDWPLSAGAGRFVGLRHARGELVLFVDGDYVLFEDWLPAAIRALRHSTDIAAVCGTDVEETSGDTVLDRRQRAWLSALRAEPEAVPVGLYRRNSLRAVGGIHPFLKGGEDRDLAHRLRAAGHRLIRVDLNMGRHHWSESGRMDYVTYFRSVLAWSRGDGQAYRLRRQDAAVHSATRRRYADSRFLMHYLLGLALAVLVLLNLAALSPPLVWIAIVGDALAFAVVVIVRRRRGWTWHELAFELHVVPYALIRHGGFLLGMLRRVPDVGSYPTGERILQSAGLPDVSHRGSD